jgi:ABC-type polar amino acid transport system ATPase subunit
MTNLKAFFAALKKCHTHGLSYANICQQSFSFNLPKKKALERQKEELEKVTVENNQAHVPTTIASGKKQERKMKSILNETCQAG